PGLGRGSRRLLGGRPLGLDGSGARGACRGAGAREGPSIEAGAARGRRPGTAAPPMHVAADEARAAAGPGVHFVDEWVAYEARGAWLLDADLAVSAHKPSLEAELAFRTRLLDCLWAALPAACTSGDV